MSAPALRQIRGRPIRFLLSVALLWIALRVVLLGSDAEPTPPLRLLSHLPKHENSRQPVVVVESTVTVPSAPADQATPWQPDTPIHPHKLTRIDQPRTTPTPLPLPSAPSIAATPQIPLASTDEPAPTTPLLTNPPQSAAPLHRDRWQMSIWLLTRGGSPDGIAPGSTIRLGDGQAGMRIARTLDTNDRFALYARASTPLKGRGQELALGTEWRLIGHHLRLIAEERIDLNTLDAAPAIGVVAGIDRATIHPKLPDKLRVEGYGQAGAVFRTEIHPYADGALRITYDLRTASQPRVTLGAGTWVAAQREGARVDVGPTLVAALPVSGSTLRIAVDWRQRVVGEATPKSGFALTIGADF